METHEETSFEEAMLELEKIVERLEEGDVPLEKAISYYQEGMKLSKLCNDKLKQVQAKMTQIMNEQGETKPFEIQGEE
ncbi:exodeoxyribonuclease VII small subunit [Lentibacillus sp. Marseille-P4043]|uniref:exodeoxyribonuclease VII small subunit n=1 Tax=Lentibacillus sp. Marseille-P4043 TaxID=2040293 RepID=UPI000D0BB30B|nr:exodeoxyribonuclease VII small subunit [Lentibacillus sp. Marseille-P4043]